MKPKTKYIIVVYTLQYYLKLEIKLLNSWAEVLKTLSLHKKSEYLRTGFSLASLQAQQILQAFSFDLEVLKNSSGHGQVGSRPLRRVHQRENCSWVRATFFLFPEKFPFYYFPSSDSSREVSFVAPPPKVEHPAAAEWGMLQICTIPYICRS